MLLGLEHVQHVSACTEAGQDETLHTGPRADRPRNAASQIPARPPAGCRSPFRSEFSTAYRAGRNGPSAVSGTYWSIRET